MEIGSSIRPLASETRISPIARLSAPGAAAQSIRAGILAGRLKPGDRLIEQDVARSLGIGQPTVREALKELEYQGLVRKSPNRGTYVTKLTTTDYHKIAEIRNVLEAMAMEMAAPCLSSEAEAELRAMVDEMDAGVRESNVSRYYENDIAFHRRIWALTGNEYLAKALEGMVFQLFIFGFLSTGSTEGFRASIRQHRAILEGLCTRDGAEARRAFITETVRFWNDALAQIPSESSK
jgi:DNA-binding GntR family transcriptional regulator